MEKMITNNPLYSVVVSMVEDIALNCELVERLKRKERYNYQQLSLMSFEQQNYAHLQSLQDKIQINKVEKFIAEELNEKLDVVIQSLFD